MTLHTSALTHGRESNVLQLCLICFYRSVLFSGLSISILDEIKWVEDGMAVLLAYLLSSSLHVLLWCYAQVPITTRSPRNSNIFTHSNVKVVEEVSKHESPWSVNLCWISISILQEIKQLALVHCLLWKGEITQGCRADWTLKEAWLLNGLTHLFEE